MTSPFSQRFDELPSTLPIFPLSGAVVLPGGHLPLNIFEPRYLNMVRDAMRSDQLIGMIQPTDQEAVPALHRVGCAGRIVNYEEFRDGRLGIVLAGLCRFTVVQELPGMREYRRIQPDWAPFVNDFAAASVPDKQAVLLFSAALRAYFQRNDLDTDWDVLEKLEVGDMVSSLISSLPLAPEAKQIILEGDDLIARLTAFTAVLSDDKPESGVRH